MSLFVFAGAALFVVLTIEQAYKVKNFTPFILAIIAVTIGLLCFKNQMLLMAILIYSVGLMVYYKVDS